MTARPRKYTSISDVYRTFWSIWKGRHSFFQDLLSCGQNLTRDRTWMIVRPMNSSASMDWWDLSFKKSTSINPITFLLSRSRIQPPSLCYRGLAVRKRWTTRPENNDWIEGFPFSKIRDPAFKPVLHQLTGQKLDDDTESTRVNCFSFFKILAHVIKHWFIRIQVRKWTIKIIKIRI